VSSVFASRIGFVCGLALVAGLALPAWRDLWAAEPQATLVGKKVIGESAPHNAFTDLIRYDHRFFCVFREGQEHVSPDGKLRVLTSTDGDTWTSSALLSQEAGDLRDAKFSVTADGRLMLSGAVAFHRPEEGVTHQTLAWFSGDGRQWTAPEPIGPANYWLWSVTWHKGVAYSVGYRTDHRGASLFRSDDGRKWTVVVDDLFPKGGYPNESSLVFAPDDRCYCLLRRDGDDTHGQIGIAKPPYTDWTWRDLQVQIGGPKLIRLDDGRLVAALRYAGRTSLCEVNAEDGKITEILQLAPPGDTSYPGLVLYDGLLWVSYHWGPGIKSAKVYLAKVRLP
jgi:hypothetical protein